MILGGNVHLADVGRTTPVAHRTPREGVSLCGKLLGTGPPVPSNVFFSSCVSYVIFSAYNNLSFFTHTFFCYKEDSRTNNQNTTDDIENCCTDTTCRRKFNTCIIINGKFDTISNSCAIICPCTVCATRCRLIPNNGYSNGFFNFMGLSS